MKRTQSKKFKYPKPFESGWVSTGSRTIDPGNTFYITVDDSGFCVKVVSGPWSVGDLFGDMEYWPKKVVWTGSSATLGQLLKQLAKANGLDHGELFDLAVEYYEECLDLRMTDYLAEEKKRAKEGEDPGSLREKWADLRGVFQIPGIPSPAIGPGCCYNGLELGFDEDGWAARLYSDAGNLPNLLIPGIFLAETFDGLFNAEMIAEEPPGHFFGPVSMDTLEDILPWTRDELAELLIEHDPLWRPFIESGGAAEN